jgi:hypothetical protein
MCVHTPQTYTLEDNIKMDLKETGCEDDWAEVVFALTLRLL